MAEITFAAVIPAAGESSRIGGFKPLLEIGGQTLVQRAVNLFQSAGVDEVVVVAGHRAGELAAALEEHPCRVTVNSAYRQGMLSSIQAGVRELRGRCGALFVLPVDIPLVRPMTIRRLMERFGGRSHLVYHPVFASRRGHPPLMDASLMDALLAWQGEGGLKGLLERYEKSSSDVAVADAWIRRDADTDEDLASLGRDFERHTVPERQECEVMLEHYLEVSEGVRAHGRAVAGVAARLGEALNAAGEDLDPGILQAAGLLHDAFKGERDHAGQAAAWLEANGFPEVAAAVGGHMDLPWQEEDDLDERALLYLADKVVEGDRIVNIPERQAALLQRYGHDEEARRAIARRLDTAERIKAAVERITSRCLDHILSGKKH